MAVSIVCSCLWQMLRQGFARITGRKPRVGAVQGDILLVFGGALGDSLVFLDTLERLAGFYRRQGRATTLVCSDSVAGFLTALRGELPFSILAHDPRRLRRDGRYFRAYVSRLRQRRWALLLAPTPSRRAELLALHLPAGEKIEVRAPSGVRRFSPLYWLNRLAYDRTILAETGSMALEHGRVLLHALGDRAYRPALSVLPRQGRAPAPPAYCVLCPTAGEREKSWPLHRMCRVIDYIAERTDLELCICTGAEGTGVFQVLAAGTRFPERLCDRTGGLPYGDWVELIRNARFCFGNDSASIHIAAAVGTPSACILPGFHFGYMHPYPPAALAEGRAAVPAYIYRWQPCFGCYTRNLRRGAGNPACRRHVRRRGRYLCVEAVTVADVLPVLDGMLDRDESKTQSG